MSSTLSVPQLSFSEIIARHGKWHPQKTAVICGGLRLTWEAFEKRTSKVANTLLNAGLAKGDKVALFLHNSIAALELIVGVVRAGGVAVPLNTLMLGDSLSSAIRNADAKFVIAENATVDQLAARTAELNEIAPDRFLLVDGERNGWVSYEQWLGPASTSAPSVELNLDDTISIIYSSGTTGNPKGIEHTHFARLTYCLGFGLSLGFSPRSVTLLTTPLYANGTWMTMMPTLFTGGTLVIMDKFDGGQFLHLVERERCTHAFMVPTQFIVTMAVPEGRRFNTSSLSVLICSGSPLSAQTLEELASRFPSAALHEIY
jgi:acyl-CoA synthetase (AMP-forming)/AMP-acid ligase II